MTIKNFHPHNCDCCIHLMSEEFNEDKYDLYFCERGEITPTVIARKGPESDYTSGLMIIKSLAQVLKQKFGFANLYEAVFVMAKKHEDTDIRMLSKAVVLATNADLLNENLEFTRQKNNINF